MHGFAAGQRWISEAEPELGLGRIVEADLRRVTILFPASGERRIYAKDSAPLKRVLFSKGDRIATGDGQAITIESYREENGLRLYRSGEKELSESELNDTLRYDRPEQRLLAGQADTLALFDVRLRTHQQRHLHCRSPVRGFLGGRMELIPHQLYIAGEVASREQPRVLLADEVGLGKTVEAGLILHRLLVTGRVRRVLILVPDALIHQWFIEMLRRFSLSFRIFDDQRCGPSPEDGESANPFLDEQLVLCGIRFLASDAGRARQVLEAGWDVLVVDEAHHLHWTPDQADPGYRLVEALASRVPGLLLLTATPEQLGLESHFARLRLLDPDRYPDLERYRKEQEGYRSVAAKTATLIRSGNEQALKELLDRHGPGRVMFRNTRAAMSGFPTRHVHPVPLVPVRPGHPDPRIVWLAGFLRAHPAKKVLVIVQSRDDVQKMHRLLQKMIEVKTALFHEDLPLLQCDRQAAWFAESDGARLMIASEIGGEGRNFQFAQDLVLMGLPEDPEMLEQRIGRLDRIGQRGDIHIHVPYLQGTREESRFRWYHEGLDAFEHPLSGCHEILEHFKDRLASVDDALIRETKTFVKALKTRIEKGRDRLLELSSFRPDAARYWVEQIAAADADRSIEDYLLALFDAFGVHAEALGGRDYLLVPGHLFDRAFPLGGDTLRITFDRAQAVTREEITLVSWDHPLVFGGMDLLLGSVKGNACFARAEGLKGFILEAVFLIECVAAPGLGADRFLPATPCVVRLDAGGKSVEKRPRSVDRPALDLGGASGPVATALGRVLEQARREAEDAVIRARDRARVEMRQALGAERDRLKALRAINDHIREEEIESLERRIVELESAFGTAALRLDAVLLITGQGL